VAASTTIFTAGAASGRFHKPGWTNSEVSYAINIACLDGAMDEELAEAPVQFENGRNKDWESPPAESRLL
jgi:hypothetical protein